MIMDMVIWLLRSLVVALIGAAVGVMLIDYYYHRKREYIKKCFEEASSQDRLFD